MGVRQILVSAISGLMLAAPALAARGRGGARPAAPAHVSHSVSRPATHVSHIHTPAQRSARANERHEAERARRHLAFEHRRDYGRTTIVYPWWLYKGYDGNPYDGDYYNNNPVSPAPVYSTPPDTGVSTPDYNAARSTMAAVQARELAELQASPEWLNVSTDMQRAMADINTATAQMQASLQARPDYRTAVDEKHAAQDRAAELHAQGGASDVDIFAAAQQDLSASTTISRIERNASASDPALVEARTRLQAAVLERKSLYDGLRSKVMSNPDWQAARQQLGSPE